MSETTGKRDVVQRHQIADYLNIGTSESPNWVLMGVGFHWTHGVAMYENVILNYGVQGDTAYLTLQGKPGYELNFSGATDQNKSSLKVMYARNIWGHDENVVRLEGESNRSGEPPQWILEFKDRIVVIENGELVDEKIK